MARTIVKERTANLAIDDPHIRCLPDNFIRAYGLPHLLKFVHTQDLLVELIDEICLENEQFVERMRPLSSAQE